MPDLLDANVWVALSVESHAHHARALQYVQHESATDLAFCRLTELALLRLLSNPQVFGSRAIDGSGAWAALKTLFASPRVTRLDEPAAIDEVLGAWASDLDVRGTHWTDAYLAAFATASGCRLISFDTDFERYPGLSWLHLKD